MIPPVGSGEGSVYATLPLPYGGREVVYDRTSAKGTKYNSSMNDQNEGCCINEMISGKQLKD